MEGALGNLNMELRGGGCAQGPGRISALKKGFKESKRWTKALQSNGTVKQAGFAILISDKFDVKLKLTRREKRETLHSQQRKS